MKGLTDIPGILVGHASDYDAITGCTVILCEAGAVAGVDVRGSATGTEEIELLRPQHLTERIHAVVLSGGSAFGLETCSGVRRYLEHKGVGFPTGAARVPLVSGAILYDLGIGKGHVRPTREMGETAAAAATDRAVAEGCVGAGTGATVGKVLGMKCAMKSGVGSWTVRVGGAQSTVLVSALAAVNAVGDVRDAAGKIVAGARRTADSMDFADSATLIREGAQAGFRRENTTLVAVATNAALTKVQATKIAQLGSAGMARAISPSHMMSDGDLVIALSMGSERATVDALGVAAVEAVAAAIVRAVENAKTMGGVPGLASRKPAGG
jgi:L-aminopeptidase/D-esterase-like protein